MFKKTHKHSLTEAEVRWAMKHTTCNKDAADLLGIDGSTWKSYASMYIDHETGKTLYELHLKPRLGAGRKKASVAGYARCKTAIETILDGSKPGYSKTRLKSRMLAEGIMTEDCAICGHNERRYFDNKSCSVMVFKNGKLNDLRLENIEMVCYNCYFKFYGDVFTKPYLNMRLNDPNYQPVPLSTNPDSAENAEPDELTKTEADEIDFSQY